MKDQPETFAYGVFWEEEYGYSQAIRAGSTIYISGQLAHDAEGQFIGEGDFSAQLGATFNNLDKVLEHIGASRSQDGIHGWLAGWQLVPEVFKVVHGCSSESSERWSESASAARARESSAT